MGIQGSGKGTHPKMLAADFDLEHIAVGDIFRWNVQHHTKLGAQVRHTMAAGRLAREGIAWLSAHHQRRHSDACPRPVGADPSLPRVAGRL
jgi:adenylate kinase family enzyme